MQTNPISIRLKPALLYLAVCGTKEMQQCERMAKGEPCADSGKKFDGKRNIVNLVVWGAQIPSSQHSTCNALLQIDIGLSQAIGIYPTQPVDIRRLCI